MLSTYRWTVVWSNNNSELVDAASLNVNDSGALVFYNSTGSVIYSIARGHWVTVKRHN